MSNYNNFFNALANVGGAIGKGIIAGFVGTVAITISQMIEMEITKREMSDAPATVGGKALGVEPRGQAKLEKTKARKAYEESSVAVEEEEEEEKVEANKEKFSQIMHFGYGTSWGIPRGLLDLAGIPWPIADAVHFGAVWGAALVMLPSTTDTPPVTKWPAKQITVDAIHHAVYAFATGFIYEAMRRSEKKSSLTGIRRFIKR